MFVTINGSPVADDDAVTVFVCGVAKRSGLVRQDMGFIL
jgi:hypothetical protein